MFIDSPSQIESIAERSHLSVFALKEADIPEIKAFYILEPGDTGKITVEATRGLIEACSLKRSTRASIIIKGLEKATEEAQNALLKLFEEPSSNYHFLIFTEEPSALLPTILSRAGIYYLHQKDVLSTPVSGDEDIKKLARELITADDSARIALADQITKKKDNTRGRALAILAAAIEISYKTYFATGRPAFLHKLEGLLKCYNAIQRNGHIKLHIIADLW